MTEEQTYERKERSTAKTWDDIRALRYSLNDPPPNWPSGVRPISQDGAALFGIDPASNKLYWDGKEVILRDRIRLRREREARCRRPPGRASCGVAASCLLLPGRLI
jgi:hypothetical protein